MIDLAKYDELENLLIVKNNSKRLGKFLKLQTPKY